MKLQKGIIIKMKIGNQVEITYQVEGLGVCVYLIQVGPALMWPHIPDYCSIIVEKKMEENNK